MKDIYAKPMTIEPDSVLLSVETQERFLYLGDASVGIKWIQSINWCQAGPDGKPIIVIATDTEICQMPVSRLAFESVKLSFMNHFPAATTALISALEQFEESEEKLPEATFLDFFLVNMEEMAKTTSPEISLEAISDGAIADQEKMPETISVVTRLDR